LELKLSKEWFEKKVTLEDGHDVTAGSPEPTYADKVRGMFLGVAIGDALGMPVEMFTAEKIKDKYGRVTEYHVPDGHKWFNGEKAGTITDDTQLTIAVAEALVKTVPGNFHCDVCMPIIAEEHVKALRESDKGWGRSTREAVRNLANGVNYEESATRGVNYGRGNGVAMKISPLGALYHYYKDDSDARLSLHWFIEDIAYMTHARRLAYTSALVMANAIGECFGGLKTNVLNKIINICESRDFKDCNVEEDDYNIIGRLEMLKERWGYAGFTPEEAIDKFGGGSCYCYDSVPFTLAFFMRNPYSIESLYDVVSAGGDTDSNGSMLASMLGACNGVHIFPDHLIDGLECKDQMFDLADRWVEAFPLK